MARRYTPALREAAARAIMARAGFVYTGASLLDDADHNPRVAGWVADADAVLAVVFPRLTKES